MEGRMLHARIRIASGKRALGKLELAQLTSGPFKMQVRRLGLEAPEQVGPSVRETGTNRFVLARVSARPLQGINPSLAHPILAPPHRRHLGISRRGTNTSAHVLTLKHMSPLLSYAIGFPK